MTPRRRVLTVLTGLALSANALTGCGLSRIVSQPPLTADGPQVTVLLDPSGSTQPDRGLYLDQFKALVAQLARRHGTIRGAALSGDSLATAQWIIDRRFAPPRDTNGYLTTLALDRSAREVDAQAARLLAHSEAGTDLLGGLQFISRYPSGRSHVVVVFSDGIQWTNELRLDPLTLAPPVASRIVRSLKSEGAIPNLAHTQVYWVGGGLHAHLNRQQLQNLQRFWTTYITQAGGTMVSWDTALDKFH